MSRICVPRPTARNLTTIYFALALGFGCASGETDAGPDSGLGSIFSDAGRVPPPPPGTPDAAPKFPPDASMIDASPPPDAASLPDAPPPPDAAAGCVDQAVQLLTNADFEAGSGPDWDETSGLGVDLVTSDFGSPHGGSFVAWLGGYNGGVDVLYQDVQIPAGATNVQFSGFFAVGTEEGAFAWDASALEIRTTAGALLETLGSWTNLDADTAWQSFTVSPQGDYQGQTVRVYLRSQTDSTLLTSFVFDDLALRATVCQ